MQPLLNTLLTPDFDLQESVAAIRADDIPAATESAATQISSLARLADLCESIRLTTARMAAVQLLLTVAQSTTDLNTRRLAATAILRFNPHSLRTPRSPKNPPHTTSNFNPDKPDATSSAIPATPRANPTPFTSATPGTHTVASVPPPISALTSDAARAHEPSDFKRNAPPSSPAGRPSVATGAAQQARGVASLRSPARRAHEPHLPRHDSSATFPSHTDLLSAFPDTNLNAIIDLARGVAATPAALLNSRRGTALPATIPRSNPV
jgi:hypothetical protein